MTTKSDIIEILNIVLEKNFPLDSANIEAHAVENWDSLKHLNIIFSLEDAFNLQFSEDEIPYMKSLNAILEHIEKKKNAA